MLSFVPRGVRSLNVKYLNIRVKSFALSINSLFLPAKGFSTLGSALLHACEMYLPFKEKASLSKRPRERSLGVTKLKPGVFCTH